METYLKRTYRQRKLKTAKLADDNNNFPFWDYRYVSTYDVTLSNIKDKCILVVKPRFTIQYNLL